MKTNFKATFLVAVFLTLFQDFIFAQDNNSIEIQFLGAHFTDTTSGKDLIAIFLLSTKDSTSFPPGINLPPRCTVFEDGREKVVLLGRHNMSFGLYGNDIAKKDTVIYDLVKHLLHFHPIKPQMVLTYSIRDLNYEFKKMSLTPSFKEKLNKEIWVEKRFEFEVD